MGGGDTVDAPKPTKEEKAMQIEQLAILKESRAEEAMLKPFYLEALGLMPIETPGHYETKMRLVQKDVPVEEPARRRSLQKKEKQTNNYQEEEYQEWVPGITTGYRRLTAEEQAAKMIPAEIRANEILQLQQERQISALRGDLPISPALERGIGTQKTGLIEGLSRRLGANWQTTTPGIQSMGEFETNAEMLREEARRGEISQGSGLALAQQGYLAAAEQSKGQEYNTYGQRLMPLLGAYGQAQQPYQQRAGLLQQANIASAQSASAERSGQYAAAGTAVGMIAMAI